MRCSCSSKSLATQYQCQTLWLPPRQRAKSALHQPESVAQGRRSPVRSVCRVQNSNAQKCSDFRAMGRVPRGCKPPGPANMGEAQQWLMRAPSSSACRFLYIGTAVASLLVKPPISLGSEHRASCSQFFVPLSSQAKIHAASESIVLRSFSRKNAAATFSDE